MSSKSKGSRCKYLSETILAIPELKKAGQLHNEVAYHFKISKSSMSIIIHREVKQSERPCQPNKPPDRPPKLDAQAQHAIICHVEKFPHDTLHALLTLSKSGYNVSRTTIYKYLKTAGYFRYKARKKPFLSSKHIHARLKWAK